MYFSADLLIQQQSYKGKKAKNPWNFFLSLLQNKGWLEKFGGDFQPGVEPLQELSGPVRSRFAVAIGTQEDFHGFQKNRGDLSPQVFYL